MRTRVTFYCLSALLIALTVQLLVWPDCCRWITVTLLVLLLIGFVWLFISTIKPMAALSNGINLLRAQDFGSRLAPVGQADADQLVEVFNSMMTQLRQERLRFHERNSFLSLLIEASPMGIIIYDFDGKEQSMNPAAKRFMSPRLAECINQVALNAAETFRLPNNQILRVQRRWFMEMGFRRQFILIESLTDEVNAAERAAYGKVIRMIAHEVNNSMAGINSTLETLHAIHSLNPDDADILELLTGCRERVQSMSNFITAYADVAKLPQPDKQLLDLNQCLQHQMPFLESMTTPHNITLQLTTAPAKACAMVDSVMFEQVIVNIVKNAIESILPKQQGSITIAIDNDPSTTVVITDNGQGIAPEIADKLFTPFLTTKPNGQGIGLLCVSEILRRHGCQFSLVTDANDHLTRFSITFPAI
jgi:nitrogen fixation/metabolism regulation signal transduction histidine kinase